MKNIKTYRLFESSEMDKSEIEEYFYDFIDDMTNKEKFQINRLGKNASGHKYISIYFGVFPEEKYEMFLECLLRFYDATGYRAVSGISKGYNRDGEEVYEAKLNFFILTDDEYLEYADDINSFFDKYNNQENEKLQKKVQ
jgi:hypothetical protein